MSSRQSLFRFGRRNASSFGAVALAAALLPAAPAAAQGSRQKAADTLYSAGLEAHREGDLEEARDRYRDAFVLERAGYIAANLGQVEAKLGEWTAAAEHLAFALAKADHTPDARANLQRVFDVVKREVATVRIEAEVGGDEVLVNDRVVGRLPLTTPVFLNPGKYTILLRSDARTTEPKAIEVAKGQSYAVEFSAGGEGTFTRDTAGARGTQRDTVRSAVIWSTLGVGVGLTAVGTYFLARGNRFDNEAEDLRRERGSSDACVNADCEDLWDALDKRDSANKWARISYAGAGAFVLAFGAEQLFWRKRAQAREQAFKLEPFVAGRFAGIAAAGQF
jgi:tetratricopeptide (TPR) repeat protein